MISSLKIITDLDCEVYVDYESIGIAYAQKIFRIDLRKGKYVLEFISVDNPDVKLTLDYQMHESNTDDLLRIDLTDIYESCKKSQEYETDENQAVIETRTEKPNTNPRKTRCSKMPNIVLISIIAVLILLVSLKVTFPYMKYEVYGYESDGLILVKRGKKYGYINNNKKIIIPIKFENADNFSFGRARININGKYGFINKKGEIVIEPIYDGASFFLNPEITAVKKGNYWGYINNLGVNITDFIYYGVSPYSFEENITAVRRDKDSWWGGINIQGEEVIPFKYFMPFRFSNGRAEVSVFGKYGYGYIDKRGEEVIPLIFSDVQSFSEGLACVKIKDKYGYIDTIGKVIIPFKYDLASSFSDDRAGVGLYHGGWGFIDKTGKTIIPHQYENIRYSRDVNYKCFSEGLAAVMKNGKWGFIDRFGKTMIPFKFDDIDGGVNETMSSPIFYYFTHGVAWARFDNQYVAINKKGEIIWK